MLCLMYGNINGYHYKGLTPRLHHESPFDVKNFLFLDLSEQLLQRKIELCKSLLRVYDAIDPGETNHRTNVTFELNCATIIQRKLELNRNQIDREEANVWNENSVALKF